MKLLYDSHCYACTIAVYLLAKLSRGYIRPVPIEPVLIGERGGAHRSIGFRETAWLLDGGMMRSGLAMLPWALLGVVRGLLHGSGYQVTMDDLYDRGSCSLQLPCKGVWGLLVRIRHFLAETSVAREYSGRLG